MSSDVPGGPASPPGAGEPGPPMTRRALRDLEETGALPVIAGASPVVEEAQGQAPPAAASDATAADAAAGDAAASDAAAAGHGAPGVPHHHGEEAPSPTGAPTAHLTTRPAASPSPQAQLEEGTSAAGPAVARIPAAAPPWVQPLAQGSEGDEDAHPKQGKGGQRKWLIIAGAGVAVLVIAAVAIAWATGAFKRETITVTPPAVTIPVPTPAMDPTRAAIDTPFYASLPGTVRDYVMVDTTANDAWVAAGALEAYDVTYSNGPDTITLTAGQWQDATQASTALGALVPTLITDPTPSANPTGAAPTGTASAPASAPPTGSSGAAPTGPAQAGWQNETAIYLLGGPSTQSIHLFYDAFPF